MPAEVTRNAVHKLTRALRFNDVRVCVICNTLTVLQEENSEETLDYLERLVEEICLHDSELNALEIDIVAK